MRIALDIDQLSRDRNSTWTMIAKTGFRKRSCTDKQLGHDGDPAKNYPDPGSGLLGAKLGKHLHDAADAGEIEAGDRDAYLGEVADLLAEHADLVIESRKCCLRQRQRAEGAPQQRHAEIDRPQPHHPDRMDEIDR